MYKIIKKYAIVNIDITIDIFVLNIYKNKKL